MNEAGQSGAQPIDGTAPELESVRTAARWLVGAAAAVIAVMLAGVQASAVSKIDNSSMLRLVGSVSAGIVGLIAAGAVLWMAARVLISPGWTLTKLAHLELTDPEAWARHRIRAELHARRAVLVPTAELDLARLYRSYRALFVAAVELPEKDQVTVSSQLVDDAPHEITYRAGRDGDEDRLRQRLRLATDIAERVVDTANLADVRDRYRCLVRHLPWLGAVAVASIGVFIWATAPTSGVPITTPIGIQLHFTSNAELAVDANLPVDCVGLTINAVALGGTLEEPVVTSIDNPRCVLRQTRIPAGTAAVIPVVKP